MLLSLGPESIDSVMQLSGVDPRVAGYIAYSLQLEANYLRQVHNNTLAGVRQQQAEAIAEVFMCNASDVEIELQNA